MGVIVILAYRRRKMKKIEKIEPDSLTARAFAAMGWYEVEKRSLERSAIVEKVRKAIEGGRKDGTNTTRHDTGT